MPYVDLAPRHRAPALSIHYRVDGPADAPLTLVCVHELGGSLASFRLLIEHLPPGVRVITFDQRGAGLSEHPVEPFTVDDLAADVQALVDALGVHTFHLLGTAMGAVVVLKAAIRLGARVQSMVLCDPTGEISAEAREYILRRATRVVKEGMRPVTDTSLANAFRGMEVRWDEPQWASYRLRYLCNAPHSFALHSEALARVELEDAELAKASCPTLVLTGSHDFIWPPEDGRRLAARLPNASFQEIQEASHFPPLQSPKRVGTEIGSFLKTVAR